MRRYRPGALVISSARVLTNLLLAAMMSLASCDSGPSEPGSAGVRVVRGPEFSGVVAEQLDETFVVEFRGRDGKPLQNGEVVINCTRFEHPDEPCFLVRPLGSDDLTFYAFNTFVTDDRGRLTLESNFNTVAGTGWIRFRDLEGTVDDSVQFTARPGIPLGVRVAPADTSVRVGQAVSLRGRVIDGFGNERSEPVTWTVSGAAGELASPGVVRGLAHGRAKAKVTYSTFADSVYVSVVPDGVLATVHNYDGPGSQDRVHVINTDGSGRVGPVVSSTCIRNIGWAPAGDRLTYTRDENPFGCFDPRIFIATIATGAQTRLRPTLAPVLGESMGRMGWTGPWFYFVARTIGPNGELWRVKTDGDSAGRVGPVARDIDYDHFPSASPDGSEVVYSSQRDFEPAPRLRILTVATGAVRDHVAGGRVPSWSPDGTRIAYVRDGQFRVANVDLTGAELTFATPLAAGSAPPSWSPDGEWLVVTVGESTLGQISALVHVNSGLVLPLGWTRWYSSVAWKPVP